MPIIKNLLSNGNEVILGVTSLTEKVFKEEFPNLERLSLPEYDISYSSILPLWLKLGSQYPKILKAIADEHELIEAYVSQNNIDFVISDNRYGLYSQKTHSIIICHQLNLKTPFFEKWSNSNHVELLKKFNEIWVPDNSEIKERLAGDLSENVFGLNCKYIGPLSRLQKKETPIKYDHLFLLSGPEPSQTELLKLLISKMDSYKGMAAFICSSDYELPSKMNFEILRLPSTNKLSELVSESKVIVCRSGYSTLMDMYLLEKKNLILIPTPGQTEQEYLAKYWQKQFNSVHLPQSELTNYNF